MPTAVTAPTVPSAPTAPTPDESWAAVVARDPAYDGAFVYAVHTTGIYCRPTCPSRRPHRENVRFYPRPDAAERDGFRECKRCRPRRPDASEGAAAAARIRRAVAYLDAHVDERVTLADLAREVGANPYHLQRAFTRRVGLSPTRYQLARRLERFKHRLQGGDTVSRATYEAGFGSSSSLYAAADAGLGMTPAAYRHGGRGVQLRYAVSNTAFGWLLVAATARGVCAVSLGDSAEGLEAELRGEFPRAEVERDDDAGAPWVAAIVEHLDGLTERPALPLDLAGTEFQMRVWRALREIPFASTRSYASVAEAIGQPGAARAVARACATNRVALVVPCHRVVREDGAPSGYRWGAERKRRLLEHERAASGLGARHSALGTAPGRPG
ncbi:MAG TPA: bifunctional DNA-binding transcriptional regulator/O6-methylguanine-DNA methyltransferase Ada [Gemmatimonadaceae bacterium]|nr:bifunctional DNA-binding transcriptional regulator/O6-methylguanine-DNA methyltransferase Ada [Gemmatimonadaceae bacterium]